MGTKLQDGNSKPIIISQAFISVRMVMVGKKSVQMETQIGGDGVMETVEDHPLISAALKQP